MEIVVRRLEPRDYEVLREIDRQDRASEAGWERLTPEQQTYLLQNTDPLALEVYRRSGYSFVAEADGQVVGYLIAYVVQRGLASVMGVRSIFVSPGSRRRGVATAMYRALNDAAVDGGIDHIFTDIGPDNIPSLRLHEKAGFRLTKEINARLDLSPVRRSFVDRP